MGAGVIRKSGGGGGRRGRRRRGSSAAMSEINVTPFVDVMLVLLIIFMVAAPMMTPGVDVQLPRTAASALPSEQEEPLKITLRADGGLMVMSTEVAESEFIPMLRGVAAERASDKVYLLADGNLPYERVAQVMGALSNAGFNNIGFVTDTQGPDFGAGN
ncbi:ExbD/TolR family protein [Pseudogemmobacter sonorensis]|uniref:ExbD/TolR family protein n=1 Tax=Pseudogemmobacter sonorensis TaxID=2989681 RepID=UPI0036925A40